MTESSSLLMPIKIESISPNAEHEEITGEEDQCTICLQPIVDRTLVPTCSHEFCFECLMVWSGQSRRCPLCAQNIGDHLIHRIRSTYDYQKHFLPPLRTSPRPLARSDGARIAATHRRRERAWGPRERAAQDEADALERAVSRRRWIYQHDLYAKHVASNKYTRYRPYPTPAQFAASQDLISRITVFLRRELLVWPNADVEFLVTFVISLMKSIDIRSESAVKLLSEFLDMDAYIPGERHVNAEHFAHEIYCYLRSPYKDLTVYDSVVQYDTPQGVHPPPSFDRTRRWEPGPSRSRSPGRRRSRSRSNGRERIRRRGQSPHPRALQHENDARRSTSPYSAAAAEDSSVQPGYRSRAPEKDNGRRLRSRSRSPPRIDSKGKGRATTSRSPSPLPKTPLHQERTRSSEILETPTKLLRSPSLDSDIPYSEPTTSHIVSHGARPKEASPPIFPRPENNNNPVTPPQPHDGSVGTTHTIPLESHQLFNLSVTGPSITPESYDPPTIKDHPARSNPARRHRYRNQRDSIIAYLRSSSTSIPRFPTAIQPAPLPSPSSDITGMVTKVDGLEAVASTTEGQGGGAGGYARLAPESPESPERQPAPAVNNDSSVGKEPGATRAQSSGGSSEAPARDFRARLLDRLSAENSLATEARLRSQARLRTRLAAERRLAKKNHNDDDDDDGITAQGGAGGDSAAGTHVGRPAAVVAPTSSSPHGISWHAGA